MAEGMAKGKVAAAWGMAAGNRVAGIHTVAGKDCIHSDLVCID